MDSSIVLVLLMLSVRNIYSKTLTRGTCNSGYVKCEAGENWRADSNTVCIQERHLCDKEPDCSDGSDERYCGYIRVGFTHKYVKGPCPTNYTLCNSGKHIHSSGVSDKRCVSRLWICDRDKDCSDGSDERYCPYDYETGFQFTFQQGSCPDDYFQCRTGKPKHKPEGISNVDCIKKSWICDGSKDCIDESDEIYCPYFFPVPTTTTPATSTTPESQTTFQEQNSSPTSEHQFETFPEHPVTMIPTSAKVQDQETLCDTTPCSQSVSAVGLIVSLINSLLIIFLIIAYWHYLKYKNSQQYLNLYNMQSAPLAESQNTNLII